jgi:hypothetical protein
MLTFSFQKISGETEDISTGAQVWIERAQKFAG